MTEVHKHLLEQSAILKDVTALFVDNPSGEPFDDGPELEDVVGLDLRNPLVAGECLHHGRLTLVDPDSFQTQAQLHCFVLVNAVVCHLFCYSPGNPAVSRYGLCSLSKIVWRGDSR